jgi:hypothetical protein
MRQGERHQEHRRCLQWAIGWVGVENQVTNLGYAVFLDSLWFLLRDFRNIGRRHFTLARIFGFRHFTLYCVSETSLRYALNQVGD